MNNNLSRDELNTLKESIVRAVDIEHGTAILENIARCDNVIKRLDHEMEKILSRQNSSSWFSYIITQLIKGIGIGIAVKNDRVSLLQFDSYNDYKKREAKGESDHIMIKLEHLKKTFEKWRKLENDIVKVSNEIKRRVMESDEVALAISKVLVKYYNLSGKKDGIIFFDECSKMLKLNIGGIADRARTFKMTLGSPFDCLIAEEIEKYPELYGVNLKNGKRSPELCGAKSKNGKHRKSKNRKQRWK